MILATVRSRIPQSLFLNGFLRIIFFVFYPIWRIIRAGMYGIKGQTGIAKAILQGLLDGFKGKDKKW